MVERNYNAIVNDYNWEKINGEYLRLFEDCIALGKRAK